MDASKFRRTVTFVASAALLTALTVGAIGAPVAAMPDEQKAEARAEAKAARDAAKQARAEARAEARAARDAAKQARAEARAEAKAARRAAKQDGTEKVTVCHKPGTPAEGMIEISMAALEAHLAHGDVEEECGTTTAATLTTPAMPVDCEEPGTSDGESSANALADEDDGSCDEPEQVVVSIDAPEAIGSEDPLQLQGMVSGIDSGGLSFAWSSTCLTDEQLTDPTVIASEPATELLVMREGTLPPATTCDFTLTVTDDATSPIGSATVTVAVTALP